MIAQVPALDDVLGLGGLELQFLIDFMLVFFLHTLRLSAFFLSAPFFGAAAIPVQVRVIVSVAIAFGFYGLIEVPDPQNLPFLSLIEVALIRGCDWAVDRVGVHNCIFCRRLDWREKLRRLLDLGLPRRWIPTLGGQTPVISQFLNLLLLLLFFR